jgi:outer membrane immunogenic protein
MRTILGGIAVKKFALAVVLMTSATVNAIAADLPVKAAPLVVPQIYSWTGFYVGANAGYGWGERSGDISAFSTGLAIPAAVAGGTIPSFLGVRPEGFVGGGQVGYNWQVNNFVFGLEADLQGSNIGQSVVIPRAAVAGLNATLSTSKSELDWFGTVRGRAGYAWNQFLLYATGGLAYGYVSDNTSVDVVPPAVGPNGLSSSTRTGWAAGAGFEWAFRPGWSVKAEYMRIDLGSTTDRVRFAVSATDFIDYRFQHSYDIARVGLNYKFGGPVVAKY